MLKKNVKFMTEESKKYETRADRWSEDVREEMGGGDAT